MAPRLLSIGTALFITLVGCYRSGSTDEPAPDASHRDATTRDATPPDSGPPRPSLGCEDEDEIGLDWAAIDVGLARHLAHRAEPAEGPPTRAAIRALYSNSLPHADNADAFVDPTAEWLLLTSTELSPSEREEPGRWALAVATADDGSFDTLLGSPESVVDAELSDAYGLGTVSDEWRRRTRGDGHAGLLTTFGMLRHAPITIRGVVLMERFYCVDRPPPEPPDIPIEPIDEEPSTHPEWMEWYLDNITYRDVCVGCHREMDELGHTLSGFDRGGTPYPSYRPSGAWRGSTFESPSELGHALAADPGVRRCVADHWITVLGARRDACVDDAVETFVHDGDWAGFQSNLASTRGFLAP